MKKVKTEIKMIKTINKYSRKKNNLAHHCCKSARLPAEKQNFNKKYPVTKKTIRFVSFSSAYLTPKSVLNYNRHPKNIVL